MKKSLLPILIIIATACNNSDSIPFLKFEGIKGNVASYKESRFEAESKFGDIYPGDLESVTKVEFDSEGHTISMARYDEDGDLEFESKNTFVKGKNTEYSYRNRYAKDKIYGKVIEQRKNYSKWEIHDGDEVSVQESKWEGLTIFTYSESGTLLAELIHNKKGQIIEQKNFDKETGDIVFRIVREFDAEGFPLKETFYQTYGDDSESFIYKEFDKKGNWITKVSFDSDGDPVAVTKREITYR